MSWPMVSLGSLGEIYAGGTPSRSNQDYWGDGFKWLSIRDYKDFDLVVSTKEQITKEGLKNSSAKLFCKDSVIISIFATLGRVAILGEDMATNQAIAAIKCYANIDNKYLMYCLKSKLSDIEKQSGGVAQKNINLSILKGLQIPLPPLETQKQIAAVLEKADQLRKDCLQMEQELNSLAQSVFIEMFGDPVTNPKGYEVRDIGSTFLLLTDYHANGSYEVLQENVELLEQGFALMVRTTDLEKNDFINGVKYISEHAYNYLTKTKVFGGELIVNKIGSAGKLYLMPKLNRPVSLAMNQFMVRFDEEKALSVFMYHLLSSQHGFHEISKKVQGAVTKTIRKDALRSIEMPIPPVNEQRTFCEFIEKQNNLLNEQKALAEQYQLQFNALMQKAFNGELNLDNAKPNKM